MMTNSQLERPISDQIYDVLKDYMELQALIPEENGGRMLSLVNDKLMKVFVSISEGATNSGVGSQDNI